MPAAALLGRWVKMASGHRFEHGLRGITTCAHREGDGEVGRAGGVLGEEPKRPELKTVKLHRVEGDLRRPEFLLWACVRGPANGEANGGESGSLPASDENSARFP